MTILCIEVVILILCIVEYASVFSLGGSVYMLLEILWRGHTHWSMGICGGICFLGIYIFNMIFHNTSTFGKCIFGSIFITVNEFITGCIVNLALGWNVWDYSNLIFNIMGQVCLIYSLLWFMLSLPAFYIASLIRKKVFFPFTEETDNKRLSL